MWILFSLYVYVRPTNNYKCIYSLLFEIELSNIKYQYFIIIQKKYFLPGPGRPRGRGDNISFILYFQT